MEQIGVIAYLRTQKAKGLHTITKNFPGKSTEILAFFQSVEAVDLAMKSYDIDELCHPVFVRPCPVRPRHGFVESVIATSMAEIREVVRKTLEADSGGEVIITRAIDAEGNFIWTPKLLTVGRGNDGATGGYSTVSLPLVGVVPSSISNIMGLSGVGEGDDPYVEGVVRQEHCSLVQLRAGPKLGEITPNYIPHPVRVTRILKAEGDLLAWEKTIQNLGVTDPDPDNTLGTVVYHPGGSLTDHYTVHARSFGIPVILEGNVTIGDILTPTYVEPKPDLGAVMRGLVVGGSTYKFSHSTRDVHNYSASTSPPLALILTSLHHSSVMGGENGKWIGFGAAMMARLGATALRGEARYLAPYELRAARPQVYAKALNRSLSRQRSGIASLTNLLMFGDFKQSSVGGPKWARCGKALTRLFTAISSFSREPSNAGVSELLRALNEAINQAHNGGWWMNKFGPSDLFNRIQEGDPWAIGYSTTALLNARDMFEKLEQSDVNRYQAAWRKWPETIISPITLKGAAVEVWPGAGLEITLQSRLFGRTAYGPRVLNIPIDWSDVPDMLSDISVLPIEGGVQIIHQKGRSKSTVLWEESITKFEKANRAKL